MKKITALIVSLAAVIGCSYLILFIVSSMYSPNAGHVPLLNDDRVISPEVEKLRPTFQKYAKQYDLEPYTDLLMAMAMQESKGKTDDVMQASESLGLPENTIDNPEKSIEAGTRYFKKAMEQADGDIRLSLQSYNFGLGFTDYVNENGGRYSEKLAHRFAERKAKELGWDRYGDPEYVDHVMRYYNNEKQKHAVKKEQ